jgi:two-component system chemotaxis response regulator CheB
LQYVTSTSDPVSVVRRTVPDLFVLAAGLDWTILESTVSTVMADNPVPIAVLLRKDLERGSRAKDLIARGAMQILSEPSAECPEAQRQFLGQLRTLCAVKAIKHPRSSWAEAISAPQKLQVEAPIRVGQLKLVAIGASAGGPPAIEELLSNLSGIPFGLAIAQHLAMGHAEGFATYLGARCRLTVTLVSGPTVIQAGAIYLARSGYDLIVKSSSEVTCLAPLADAPYVPCVDRLFKSMAQHLGCRSAAVVLSGMGRDGAQGLAELRASGSVTFCQSESGCAVYGMPAAARPDADYVLSPRDIAKALAMDAGQNRSFGQPQ